MIPRWVGWSVVALLSYGSWAVLSKLTGSALSAAHSQALSTVGMLPLIAALGFSKGATNPGLWRRGVLVALAGGAVSCVGNIPYFAALDAGGKAAAVVPVTALYPVVTVLLGMGVLGERLGRAQGVGIALSLVAIYLLNVPDERGLLSAWLVLALVPVALWGLAGFLQKLSTRDVSDRTSAAWFLGAFVPVGLAIHAWEPLPPGLPWRLWAVAVALGFALAFGNYAVTVAYASGGKASVITPLVGLYPLASIPAALLLFDERLGWREALGVALALAGIVALSHEPPARPSGPSPEEGFRP
jgi:bacterial/archaeal transporter family protein